MTRESLGNGNGNGNGRLGDLADRIFAAQRQIAEATVATGRNLTLGRRLLAQPDWCEWVEDVGLSPEAAEQLQQVAERFGQAAADVVDSIAPGALLALSPPQAREAAAAAIGMARRGRRVTYADALELLARHCQEQPPE